MVDIKVIGLKELQDAVKRNPQKVLDEARKFLVRGIAVYKSGIINNPWRVGESGGGSPVSNDPRYRRAYQRQRSGNLRDSHKTAIHGLEATIGPDTSLAPYAQYVHYGTRKTKGRHWLDYTKENKDPEIKKLYEEMMSNIVSDLAK